MRDAIGRSARRFSSIEKNPGEKGTRVIRPSVQRLLLLPCAEHAPHLFYKLGKNLGQNAVGSQRFRNEQRMARELGMLEAA